MVDDELTSEHRTEPDRSRMYHEEAMTVGLPPCDRCAFTENRFRECKNEARRSYYGVSSRAKSEKAAEKYK